MSVKTNGAGESSETFNVFVQFTTVSHNPPENLKTNPRPTVGLLPAHYCIE